MNSKFKTVVIIALAAVMLLGTAAPVAAQSPTESVPVASVSIFGEVTGVALNDTGEGSIELSTDQGVVKISLDADTAILRASFIDIVAGSRLAVTARPDGDELVAVKVLLIPGAPSYTHVTGTVDSVEGNTINVRSRQGDTFSLSNAAAGNMTAPGEQVTAVMPANIRAMQNVAMRVRAAEAVTSGNQTRVQTTTTARVMKCVEISPELLRRVTVSAPAQISRRLLENMPEDNGGTVFDNMEPEMALRIWLSLPTDLNQEIFNNLPDELKRELIQLIPELAKEEAWLDWSRMQELWGQLEPDMALKIFQNTPPELLRAIWEYVPTGEVNQVWQRLTDREIRRVWPQSSTESVSANYTPQVRSVTPVRAKGSRGNGSGGSANATSDTGDTSSSGARAKGR